MITVVQGEKELMAEVIDQNAELLSRLREHEQQLGSEKTSVAQLTLRNADLQQQNTVADEQEWKAELIL